MNETGECRANAPGRRVAALARPVEWRTQPGVRDLLHRTGCWRTGGMSWVRFWADFHANPGRRNEFAGFSVRFSYFICLLSDEFCVKKA